MRIMTVDLRDCQCWTGQPKQRQAASLTSDLNHGVCHCTLEKKVIIIRKKISVWTLLNKVRNVIFFAV